VKKICLPLILVFALVCFAEEADMQSLVQGNTDFALDMYHKISQTSGNIFFSPYSISTALAMTYVGARRTTEEQMVKALHFTLAQSQLHSAFNELQAHFQKVQEDSTFRLNISNALWVQHEYQFRPEFIELNRQYYGAILFPLDFKMEPEKSRLEINKWVKDKTEGKIKDLLSSGVIKDFTRLVLINTIYFKADWSRKFDPKKTQELDFWQASE